MEEGHREKELALEEVEKCSNLMGKMEVDDLVKHSHNIPSILRHRIQDQTIVHKSNQHSSRSYMFFLRTYFHKPKVAMVKVVETVVHIVSQMKLKHCEYSPYYSILSC